SEARSRQSAHAWPGARRRSLGLSRHFLAGPYQSLPGTSPEKIQSTRSSRFPRASAMADGLMAGASVGVGATPARLRGRAGGGETRLIGAAGFGRAPIATGEGAARSEALSASLPCRDVYCPAVGLTDTSSRAL